MLETGHIQQTRRTRDSRQVRKSRHPRHSRESRQSRQTRVMSFCQDNPDKYRLCAQHICVPVGISCPCRDREHFRCADGRCLRPDFLCDGYRDCADGRDEEVCHRVSDESSLPLFVGVGVGSVVAIAVVVTMVIFFLRRRKPRCLDNEPARKPLQNGSSTSDPSSLDIVSHPSRYIAVSNYDNFTDFDDVLCTSTPRPDVRHLVHPGYTQNEKPKTDKIVQTKVI